MKKIFVLNVLLWLFIVQTTAQVVETVITHSKIADGLYVDSAGHVFTTSGGLTGGIEIGKYDIQASVYNPNFATGFSGPINIAPYRDSLFIVSNYDNSTAYSYNLNSHQIDTIAAGLDGPAGIAIDSNDNIYISNWGQWPAWAGHQIHKISSTGAVSVYVDSSALYRPQGITINHEEEVIVHSQQKLYKINPIDSTLNLWVNVGHYLGNMTFRKKDSCIYAAANAGHKIIKIDNQGAVSVFLGSTQGYQDGGVDSALFTNPLGVAFTASEDTLYVCEGGTTNRLRRIIINQTVGIVPLEMQAEIKVFPNPSKDVFTIELEHNNEITIDVFNSSGKLIYSKANITASTIPIDLTDYSKGKYIIRCSSENQVLTKEIIKL